MIVVSFSRLCFVLHSSFDISGFVTLVTLLRLRVRRPPQRLFLSRGLVAAHRPPWRRALRRHDLDHDEKAEACGLSSRARAKRRWKPNRAPIRRDFRTLHRCIARRESEYRCREESRPDRFAPFQQSFSPRLDSFHWPSLSAEIDRARGPAGKRSSRRW